MILVVPEARDAAGALMKSAVVLKPLNVGAMLSGLTLKAKFLFRAASDEAVPLSKVFPVASCKALSGILNVTVESTRNFLLECRAIVII